MAFLIPAIESLRRLGSPPPSGTISVLIISPTRELAQQIAAEANSLLTFHQPYKVQCVYGGTNIKSDKSRLARERCDFLVATPGRLIDHLQVRLASSSLEQFAVATMEGESESGLGLRGQRFAGGKETFRKMWIVLTAFGTRSPPFSAVLTDSLFGMLNSELGPGAAHEQAAVRGAGRGRPTA